MGGVFSENLAALRRSSGVSQREAAQALEVSQALLSHYEKGIREPGLDFVRRAADYYRVTTDQLLGRLPTPEEWHPIASPSPSRQARETEEDIRVTLDVIFDLLNSNYSPDVTYYGETYLCEVLYELLRHLLRASDSYDSTRFALDDKNFDSGAVVSDITWVRAQYIIALKQFTESGGRIADVDPISLVERYGALRQQAMERMINLVGHRITHQNMTENAVYNARFQGKAPGVPARTDTKEEALP